MKLVVRYLASTANFRSVDSSAIILIGLPKNYKNDLNKYYRWHVYQFEKKESRIKVLHPIQITICNTAFDVCESFP